MSIVDPISDMLTRIRNAYAVAHPEVSFEYSNVKAALCEILKANSYIEDFKNEDKKILVSLKYNDGKPAASSIERVSKPGRRVYVKSTEIPSVLSGQGIAVVSTSKGLMTGDDAKASKMGGELICKVY